MGPSLGSASRRPSYHRTSDIGHRTSDIGHGVPDSIRFSSESIVARARLVILMIQKQLALTYQSVLFISGIQLRQATRTCTRTFHRLYFLSVLGRRVFFIFVDPCGPQSGCSKLTSTCSTVTYPTIPISVEIYPSPPRSNIDFLNLIFFLNKRNQHPCSASPSLAHS